MSAVCWQFYVSVMILTSDRRTNTLIPFLPSLDTKIWSLTGVPLLSSLPWANLSRCTAPWKVQGARKRTPLMSSGWETACHFSMQTPTSFKSILAAIVGRSWACSGRQQVSRFSVWMRLNDYHHEREAATPGQKMSLRHLLWLFISCSSTFQLALLVLLLDYVSILTSSHCWALWN